MGFLRDDAVALILAQHRTRVRAPLEPPRPIASPLFPFDFYGRRGTEQRKAPYSNLAANLQGSAGATLAGEVRPMPGEVSWRRAAWPRALAPAAALASAITFCAGCASAPTPPPRAAFTEADNR